jgi:hypothetical protein
MKKYLLSALAFAMATAAFAQVKRTCGADQHEQYLQQKDPKRTAKRAQYEAALQQWLASNPQAAQKQQAIVTIPLVVHLVYQNATENIQDAQIQSQIDVLNADFTRTNADAANTPSAFQGVASSPQIQFCWATVDPNGNPTNGIERRQTTVASFSTNDNVKFFSSGGLDAWDVTKYFNIWVCDLGSSLLGYGEFPTGTASNTWGFVANYWCFGDTLQAAPPFNKGRTATHEIGHCLNLFHIWGDDGGACTGSDQCSDTPNQASENYGCPTFPHTDACQTASPGVMYMNYMDYTDDACMNMFTAGQSARMVAIINNPPYNSLTTSTVCASGPTPPDDAGITSILSPTGSLCGVTSTIPSVVIKNFGSATLTSATINYQLDGGTVQTTPYSGSLAALATATVSLPSVSLTPGTHTLSVYTTLPNGNADGNTNNDAASPSVFTVVSSGGALPLVEGFESTTFPPTGWTRNNPDAGVTWDRTTSAKKSGVASIWMDNWNYSASGEVDEMVTPALDLSQGGANMPTMTYQVAYRLYTDPSSSPNYSDTLNVMISTDCGQTYTSLAKKFGSSFTTATPVFSTALFVPTATQWRMETVSLSSYTTATTAFIKFRHTTDYENSMYIDDINIDYLSGISANALQQGFSVYPNPSATGKFYVDIKQQASKVHKLSVYDVLGNRVFGIDQEIPSGIYELTLEHLSNGTYLVEVISTGGKPAYTKIVINK